MSMIELSVDMFPSALLVAADFVALGGQIKSYKEPLTRAIQEVVSPSIFENFVAGGRPEPWEPISPDTVRQRFDPSGPPLTDTRILRRVASQLNAWEVDSTSASMTKLPSAEYGAFHQSGTKNMPQREFALLQDDDTEKIAEVFAVWLEERFVRRGFI